jgi:SAM-dependent methyltransferase
MDRASRAPDPEPCDVCGATALWPHLEVSLVGMLDAWVHACRACGFRQVRPRLTADELRRLYPGDYFDSSNIAVGFSDYARQQQRNERYAYFLARRLKRLGRSGRVLEVGCALGFLLEALRRYSGWEVEGLDVSAFAAAFGRRRYGLDLSAGTIEEAGLPDGRFDLLIQKDLLEHVTHPRRHLLETARVLKPGGRVWLVTPNGDANLRPLEVLARALEGSRPPRLPLLDQGHLQFFRRDHLLRLFAECGFEVESLRSIGVRRGLRALGWLPRKRRWMNSAEAGHTRGGVSGAGRPGDSRRPVDTADGAGFEPLYSQVCREIDGRHQGWRSWPAYFHLRELARRLDTLPGSAPFGFDFEIWLVRR